MAARPGRKQRIDQLMAENLTLRKQLADQPFLPDGMPPGELDLGIASDFRDQMAAMALVRSNGHVRTALAWLGCEMEHMTPNRCREYAETLFGNERVQKILNAKLGPLSEAKDAIMRRQMDLALFGEPDQATRAAQFLAGIYGWNAPKKLDIKQTGLTFHQIMSNPNVVTDYLSGMREPGAPIAVTSEAMDPEHQLIEGHIIENEHD